MSNGGDSKRKGHPFLVFLLGVAVGVGGALVLPTYLPEGLRRGSSIEGTVLDKQREHLITSVNWAEVRYIVVRRVGESGWADVRARLSRLPIEVVSVDRDLAEQAAQFKVDGAISLADCFAAALAKQRRIPVCTGDPEFRTVEAEVEICWL